VGVYGGCEAAVQRTQLAIESSDTSVVMKLDFTNAFNTISRAAVANAVYGQPCLECIWGIFDFSYQRPSPLLMYDGSGKLITRMRSFEGVRQGDSLGSFGFALAV
jgi:hypothetical protein